MTLAASDIKVLYSEGASASRPSSGVQALAAWSLGGRPRNPATAASHIPDYVPATGVNLENLFDDTLETENEGTGTFVNYRAIFIYNDTSDETLAHDETLFRARIYGAPRNLDSNTALHVAVLARSDAAYNAVGTDGYVTVPTNEATLPVRADGTALAFRDLPDSAANATPLTVAGTGTIDLRRHDFIGIVLRRTVTRVASPAGQTESVTLTIDGGTPTA